VVRKTSGRKKRGRRARTKTKHIFKDNRFTKVHRCIAGVQTKKKKKQRKRVVLRGVKKQVPRRRPGTDSRKLNNVNSKSTHT
jgi:hypothetical protein